MLAGVLALLAGCRLDHWASPLPGAMSPPAVAQRITVPPATSIDLNESVIKPADLKDITNDQLRFSVTEAVNFARANNPRLRAARANIDRARGQEAVAFSPFLPQFDILSQTGYTSNNQGPGSPGAAGFLIGTGDGAHQYAQAEMVLQWTLYDFGRTSSRFREVTARARLAELQWQRAVQTIDFDVAAAYYNVLLARAYGRVQDEAIQRAESILHDTNARRKNGVADKDDVLRAEVQLSESREALVNAREAEFISLAKLNNVMGRNAGLPLQVIDFEIKEQPHRPLPEYLSVAANERPEIGVAREAVAAAVAERDFRAADFRPHIFTRAAVGYVAGDNVRTGWQDGAGLHFNVPLYTGGRHRGELQSAAAVSDAEIANAQTILDGISLEVNVAYRIMVASGEKIGLSRTAVLQSEENLRLMRVKYRNGTATPTDIVDAETSLTRSQNRYFSAMYNYLAAVARLGYAMGQPPGMVLGPATAEQLPPPRPAPQGALPPVGDVLPASVKGDPVWTRAP